MINLDELLHKYNSPFYLFYEDEFCDNYKQLKDAIGSIYPKYIPAYSYKTNYTPYICGLVKKMGGYAEVVSDMEYSVAKSVGYDDSKIIYNGPVKGPLSFQHLLGGGISNIDNTEEANEIVSLAKSNPDKVLSVGIRVNLDVGQGFVSRFGVADDSNELRYITEVIKEQPNIILKGIHMHVGRTRGAEAWRLRAVKMIELADKLFDDVPEFIDLGSGMFGCMEDSLACQFGTDLPTYSDYAKSMAVPFKERYGHLPFEKQPILFTEPGTTVVSRYMDFVSTVRNIKHLRNKTFIALDCSVDNIGTMCKIKKLPIKVNPCGAKQEEVKDAAFVGYTCLEYDVMQDGFSGNIAVGDHVIFGNVGGYSNVSKPPFILWNCPMLTLKSDGTCKVIKRQEAFDDIFGTYLFE